MRFLSFTLSLSSSHAVNLIMKMLQNEQFVERIECEIKSTYEWMCWDMPLNWEKNSSTKTHPKRTWNVQKKWNKAATNEHRGHNVDVVWLTLKPISCSKYGNCLLFTADKNQQSFAIFLWSHWLANGLMSQIILIPIIIAIDVIAPRKVISIESHQIVRAHSEK